MENENFTCGICSIPYDTNEHTPRILINCGHTLCSQCLIEIIKSPNQRMCPFDKSTFTVKKCQNYLDHFPKNFALLPFLDSRSSCVIHGEKLTLFCLKDNVKICTECAFCGEHKGHSMKMIKELKAKGKKLKKDLKEGLVKFEKCQLERDREMDLLKQEFSRKMRMKLEEIQGLIREKELEWTNLVEVDMNSQSGSSLKKEAEKVLEEIEQEENLAVLNKDFSGILSRLQPQAVSEENSKLLDEISRMTDCMESFLVNQAKTLKDFDLSSSDRVKPEPKQSSSENLIETKQEPVFFQTISSFTLGVSNEGFFIKVKDPNPTDPTRNLDTFNKLKRVSIELSRYDSLFQDSTNLNFLSEILHQLNNFTSLAVSFEPEGLTDSYAFHLINLLFERIQHLTGIEISFEQCKISEEPVLFFCNEFLSKATSLRNLTLKLGSPLTSDESLSILAQSLSPHSKNLQTFTLGANDMFIMDDGLEKIFDVILGVKELNLQLQRTLITDRSLKTLGDKVMPWMKNLEKFTLNASENNITMEGVDAIFTGVPEGLSRLELSFEGVSLPNEVISSFEEKVFPKIKSLEDVCLRLEGKDLEVGVSMLLENFKRSLAKRMEV